ALFELLLPQTDIVVAHSNLLSYWTEQGLLPKASPHNPAQALLDHGAGWVLSGSASLRNKQLAYVLQGHKGQTSTWSHDPLPARLQDTEGPLACAITAALACGHSVEHAVDSALAYAKPLMTQNFQPGMGQRFF